MTKTSADYAPVAAADIQIHDHVRCWRKSPAGERSIQVEGTVQGLDIKVQGLDIKMEGKLISVRPGPPGTPCQTLIAQPEDEWELHIDAAWEA